MNLRKKLKHFKKFMQSRFKERAMVNRLKKKI